MITEVAIIRSSARETAILPALGTVVIGVLIKPIYAKIAATNALGP